MDAGQVHRFGVLAGRPKWGVRIPQSPLLRCGEWGYDGSAYSARLSHERELGALRRLRGGGGAVRRLKGEVRTPCGVCGEVGTPEASAEEG